MNMINKKLFNVTLLSIGMVSLLFLGSCSPKYGCPSVEQADLNKKSKKAKSGLYFPGNKKSKKRR